MVPFLALLLAADPTEFFEAKVRPVLANKCFACHSSSRMGGLDLTNRAAALKGGNSGPAVVPGKPADSLLVQAVSQTHSRLKMPPSGKLPDSDVQAITAWVTAGAIWPEGTKVDVPPPSEYVISAKQRAFWSFQPIRKPEAASIDELWLKVLKAKNLKPNPQADRRTLIRRAYFDLLGLPPKPEEVEAFVKDKSPDAWPKLIDKLLASPHYGERWGRYWLDVARYSDDQLASQMEVPHPSAYRYRDWVIKAFNDDMPYDTFVKAQFAGDQIKGREKELAAGTGFFSMSPEQQDDRVDAATRGFLGLTVACAKCHDHKFDPIPTKDYYSFLGVFMSTKKDEFPLADPEVVKAYNDHIQHLTDKKKELADLQGNQAREMAKIFALDTAKYLHAAKGEKVDGLDADVLKRWGKYLKEPKHEHAFLKDNTPEKFQEITLKTLKEKEHIDEENKIRLGLNPNRKDLSGAELLSLPREEHYLWRDLFSDRRPSIYIFKDRDLDRFLSPLFETRVNALRTEIKKLEDTTPEHYPFLETISDVAEPKDIKIQVRGNAENLGEVAPRRFLQILSKGEAAKFTHGSGRLELAEQIVDRQNPLTARVITNRVWQWHFGKGIVATASNYGQLGERPMNPELLDYLASRLMEDGWSIKKLHREVMTSAAYMLSDARSSANEASDGDNKFLWRANRRRLDIEALRDSMLAVTGELDLSMGGQPRRLNEEPNKRRTIYGFVSRRDLDQTLLLFDFANPNATSERRTDTSTPLQRLFFLNSAFVERRADELACRLEKVTSPEAKVQQAYEILFQRAPSKEELRLGLDYVKSESGSWRKYTQVLLASNEFVYIN